jgi:hypothetical protein
MLVEHCLGTGQKNDSETEAQKYWKELNIEIERLSEFRNLLAHNPIMPAKLIPAVGENGYMVMTSTDEMVIPNKLYGKKPKKPFESIKVADLKKHLELVSKMREKLRHVSTSLQHCKKIADNKRKS